MKSACVGVLSIIELKNARWNIEILSQLLFIAVEGNLFKILSEKQCNK